MSENIIQSIINKLGVSEVISEYINVIKKGKNYLAICPFHYDNNPSLSISNEKKIFKCFACGVGGNVINFVANYEKISFKESIVKLAKKAEIEINENFITKHTYDQFDQKIINALNEAKKFFQYNLITTDGKKVFDYITKRDLSTNDAEKYAIGYAPKEGLVKFMINKGFDKSTLINASLMNDYEKDFFKDRIMFAILNKYNDTIGFSGRIIEGDGPKYINSIESSVFKKSNVFYNINNALLHINQQKEVYINEGFMDVIALDKIGIKNTLAIMGTSMTKNHINFLKNKQVNLMFDDDDAGINASLKSIKLLLENNIKIKVIANNTGEDADGILKKYGKEKLKIILNNKINVFDYIYLKIKRKITDKGIDSIKQFLQKFGEYLKYGDEIEKKVYVNKMTKEFHLPEETILKYIPEHFHKNFNYIKNIPKSDNIKTINYSYVLIKSILKNPYLKKSLKYNEIHFYEPVLINIAKYLIKDQENIKKKEEYKYMINKINSEINDKHIINDKEELKNVIEYINEQTENKTKKDIINKIKNSKSQELKNRYLKSLQKFQRKKEGN